MAVGAFYHQGWTLDDVHWSMFEPEKVDPVLLAAVKAAALVEYNAPDYVVYLKRVFANAGAETLDAIERWGCEEGQHGKALSRWAQTADPDFKMDEAFARFRKGYTPAHFASGDAASVRGSRRGEMIARCVVESGTSSYYSAIRDATDEPLLKEIAGRIAADEYRHYKLFLDILHRQNEPELPFWRRLLVAVTRVKESDDDELAYAYYAANMPPSAPYDRVACVRLSAARALSIYRPVHIKKLVQMIAKAIGANPQGRITRMAGTLVWRMLRVRAGISAHMAKA
jgi:hypothetical protein